MLYIVGTSDTSLTLKFAGDAEEFDCEHLKTQFAQANATVNQCDVRSGM